MTTFGLITEGLTDQIVIEYILADYFNNLDLQINPLQPERDKDDENKVSNYGGWSQVFEFCKTVNFQQAFQFNDYIIIQVDTDVSEDYGVFKQDEKGICSPEQLIQKVIKKFRLEIGERFYDQYENRIIFAISVHSIECWLLPLYYPDNRKEKLVNCLSSLNQKIDKKHQFTIDVDAKNPDYYRKISKQYFKQKVLMKFYQANPSLRIFIENLEQRNIVIEKEDY
jgi:hypothetical protein